MLCFSFSFFFNCPRFVVTVLEALLRGWVRFELIHGTRQRSFRARLARLASKYGGGISN